MAGHDFFLQFLRCHIFGDIYDYAKSAKKVQRTPIKFEYDHRKARQSRVSQTTSNRYTA